MIDDIYKYGNYQGLRSQFRTSPQAITRFLGLKSSITDETLEGLRPSFRGSIVDQKFITENATYKKIEQKILQEGGLCQAVDKAPRITQYQLKGSAMTIVNFTKIPFCFGKKYSLYGYMGELMTRRSHGLSPCYMFSQINHLKGLSIVFTNRVFVVSSTTEPNKFLLGDAEDNGTKVKVQEFFLHVLESKCCDSSENQ